MTHVWEGWECVRLASSLDRPIETSQSSLRPSIAKQWPIPVHLVSTDRGAVRDVELERMIVAGEAELSSYMTGSNLQIDGGITAAYVTPE